MKTFFSMSVTTLMIAATLGLNGAAFAGPLTDTVFSASASGSKPKRVSTKHKTEPKVKKVQFYRGSEETVSERSARLKRECKGGVNAGACAGYTR